MTKKTQTYDNESIQSLKGADRVRKRPGVIFGSDGIEGCRHTVFEILSNSIDEARGGHGDKISVKKFKDGSIEIEDFGRGIPVDFNQKEDRFNWELLFCELYAGGKYNEDDESYAYSLGLNGLGLCATQYASRFMTVDVYRDNLHYHLDFERGENVGGLIKEETRRRKTGSCIRYLPDNDVFTDIDIDAEYLHDTIKRQAVVNAGITFELIVETGEGKSETIYLYEKGIEDYLTEIVGDDYITPVLTCQSSAVGRDREDRPEYRVQMNAAFCFSNKQTLLEYYHNSSYLEHGGSPERAVKTAFVNQIDSYLKQKNLYKKGESRITFADVQDCLCIVTSGFSTQTSYENQTKKAITNRFITIAMTDFLKHQLEVYFIEKPDDAQKIASQILINKQSREQAEKTRQNLKKTIGRDIDIANRVQKFVDCRTKDLSMRELYIVEGDSALGACKTSRDAEFQAIIPVRGKILNCLKSDYARIFKSEIITDIIKVLGCGVDVPGKSKTGIAGFDIDSLRWNKIIICTDADVDGYQIRTLILALFYRLMPELIEQGYIYIAESPLYEVNTKKKTYFAYTEQEKSSILEKIGKDSFTIQRSKGLGENEPDMMWMTTMNPETRRLIKVERDTAEHTASVFELLLGDNLAGRKDFIANHGYEYLEDIDVS